MSLLGLDNLYVNIPLQMKKTSFYLQPIIRCMSAAIFSLQCLKIATYKNTGICMLPFCGSFLKQYIKLSVRKYPHKVMQKQYIIEIWKEFIKLFTFFSTLTWLVSAAKYVNISSVCIFCILMYVYWSQKVRQRTTLSTFRKQKKNQPKTNGVTSYLRHRGSERALNHQTAELQGMSTNHSPKGASSWPSRQGAWLTGVKWQDCQL